MSRVYPSIQGCPFRKIVSRKYDRAAWVETLSCGHTHSLPLGNDGFAATKRRCYTCKWEAERKKK